MTTKESALDLIRLLVWSGMENEEGVFDSVHDSGGEGGCSETWLHARIAEEFAKKEAEELTWPETTDCDRLDAAFMELWRRNIIAVQAAGWSPKEALNFVTAYRNSAGIDGAGLEGYCCFLWQDLQAVLDGQDLILHFEGSEPDQRLRIGTTISQVLQRQGFNPLRDDAHENVIRVPGIRWKKRAERGWKHSADIDEHCRQLRTRPESSGGDGTGSPAFGGMSSRIKWGGGLAAAWSFLLWMAGTCGLFQGFIEPTRQGIPAAACIIMLCAGALLTLFVLGQEHRWLYLLPAIAAPVLSAAFLRLYSVIFPGTDMVFVVVATSAIAALTAFTAACAIHRRYRRQAV